MRLLSLLLPLALSACTSGPATLAPTPGRGVVDQSHADNPPVRERVSINDGWRFTMGDPAGAEGRLLYDVRPDDSDAQDDRPADARPEEAVDVEANQAVLKPWILPTANDFLGGERYERPAGHPGADVPYVQRGFDDSGWERVDLPHDWAIAGPWLEEGPYGGMGRLPSWGVGWYRRALDVPAEDAGRRIFLDVDGAMSYATVWLNEQLVGGWPFGYASWRVDLTPYVEPGGENQLVVRNG
jgi:beta-galactosidase